MRIRAAVSPEQALIERLIHQARVCRAIVMGTGG